MPLLPGVDRKNVWGGNGQAATAPHKPSMASGHNWRVAMSCLHSPTHRHIQLRMFACACVYRLLAPGGQQRAWRRLLWQRRSEHGPGLHAVIVQELEVAMLDRVHQRHHARGKEEVEGME